MEETRKARHDLRQHLNLIRSYLDSGDRAALQTYITAYGKTLPKDTERSYCKNCAADVVIRYYAEEARKDGTDFICRADLPETLPLDEPELCALMGNLLENAVEACRGIQDEMAAFIRLHILLDGSRLTITVDNTCPVPSRKNITAWPVLNGWTVSSAPPFYCSSLTDGAAGAPAVWHGGRRWSHGRRNAVPAPRW